MVIWITGLSGAGKTVVAHRVWALWREAAPNTVIVDGDVVRRLIGASGGADDYTIEARRAVALRIAEICAWLDAQDINVVCSTISMFQELRDDNRRRFSGYFEVFLDVPMETLRRRDVKDIYTRAARGELINVIGVDLPFEPPVAPDLRIDNSVERADFDPLAREILAAAGQRAPAAAPK